jgi:hypothetical protein
MFVLLSDEVKIGDFPCALCACDFENVKSRQIFALCLRICSFLRDEEEQPAAVKKSFQHQIA